MKKIFLNDEPNLEIFLRRNSNSRRMSLRISALDGKITLTGPRNINLNEFKKFAESKKSWLKSMINSFDTPIFVSEGAQIPILGNKTLISLSDVKKPKKDHWKKFHKYFLCWICIGRKSEKGTEFLGI